MGVFLVVVVYLFYLIIITIYLFIFFGGGAFLFCFCCCCYDTTLNLPSIMNKPIKLATSVNNFHNSLHCLFWCAWPISWKFYWRLSHQLCQQLLGTPFAMALYDNHFQQWEHPEPKDACHDPTGQKSHLHKDNCKFTPEVRGQPSCLTLTMPAVMWFLLTWVWKQLKKKPNKHTCITSNINAKYCKTAGSSSPLLCH